MQLTYARTSNNAIDSQIKSRQQYEDAREKRREEKMTQREAEETLRVEARQRAEKCQEHRALLESYLQARRLYRQNDSGEREYLDDSQILEARKQVEEKIAETCS
jgi:catalase